METNNDFSEVAGLIGEPARATMLWSLLDGRAYTASELAVVSNISAQSASNHLNKLVEADFLKVEKQGKHRYYRVSRQEVASTVEAIASLLPDKKLTRKKQEYKNGDIQFCRTCYDHLSGKIAVDLTQALVKQKMLILKDEEFLVSTKGETWFKNIGLDITKIEKGKRHFAKPCLDWTERKYHLAGALGAALLKHIKKNNWVKLKANSRTVILTAKGISELRELGINLLFPVDFAN